MRDFVAHVLTPSRHVPKPLEPEQIVVLTPYLQQKELLQSALEKAKLQVREPVRFRALACHEPSQCDIETH